MLFTLDFFFILANYLLVSNLILSGLMAWFLGSVVVKVVRFKETEMLQYVITKFSTSLAQEFKEH